MLVNLWKSHFLGHFNAGMRTIALKEFCKLCSCTSLINKLIYYKNLVNPSYIDLILRHNPKCIQNSNVLGTGLSNFHQMVVTVMKTSSLSQKW